MRIAREGNIRFIEAGLIIMEEGISKARDEGGWNGAKAWERQFKKDVFARIVQTLNRLGWTLTIPEDKIKSYGISFARDHRFCVKGDLKADLSISGRCIELKLFQSINCPDRPDHEGRYQSDKEKHMPYLMRLEMLCTRNRIRDYLCNVFDGYSFDGNSAGRSSKRGVSGLTAIEYIDACYKESWHFKGDLTTYQISDYNSKSADGLNVEHGKRVFFFDGKGRIRTGIAYYNINNMWWVASGKYAVTNKASSELYVSMPENPRVKRNTKLRRSRLEGRLSKAVLSMEYERAVVFRDLLFKKGEQIYCLYHSGHNLYHCSGFSGYTKDQGRAGKFTLDELKGWANDQNVIVKLGDSL